MTTANLTTKAKSFFKDGLATGQKAFEIQTQFMDEFFKTNAAAMAELTDARINNLQESATAKSVSEFYEYSVSFNELWTEKMKSLYKDNSEIVNKYRKDVTELMPSGTEMVGEFKSAAEKAYSSAKDSVSSVKESVSSVLPGSSEKPAAKKPAPKKAAASTAA